jgi:hypothetical protein
MLSSDLNIGDVSRLSRRMFNAFLVTVIKLVRSLVVGLLALVTMALIRLTCAQAGRRELLFLTGRSNDSFLNNSFGAIDHYIPLAFLSTRRWRLDQ